MPLTVLLSKEKTHKLKVTYPHNSGKTALGDPQATMRGNSSGLKDVPSDLWHNQRRGGTLGSGFDIVLY